MNFVLLFIAAQPRLSAEPTEAAQKQVTQSRAAQDRHIREAVQQERGRLRDFIRRRMPDTDAAEDIPQDVFYELTEAYRLTKPIRQVASWLFGVARNKINDWYRRPKTLSLHEPSTHHPANEPEHELVLSDWLATVGEQPDDELFNETVLETLTEALEELPPDQREVFVRHELEGQSFKEISATLGISVNTLLSRKHYAVLHLRERLRSLYNDWLESL